MRSRPAIPAETNDNALDQEVTLDPPKEKKTSSRKATLDRARERAKEMRDQLKISNEKLKPLDEPQSVKLDIETPFPLE